MDRSPYEEIKARNFSSSIGALLVDIHNEAAPPKPKPKPKPKNYAKENARRLKEIQDKRKLKEEERLKSAKKEINTRKYRNVKSKVFTNRSSSAPSQFNNVSPEPEEDVETSQNRPFTAESSVSLPPSASQCGDASDCSIPSPLPEEIQPDNDVTDKGEQLSEEERNRSLSSVIEDDINETIPEEDENNISESPVQRMSALSLGRESKLKKNNYIEENKLAVQRATSSMHVTSEPKEKLHQLGEVPKYLLQRQQQWKDEEIKRNKEKVDPTVPPGHKLLSDEEKQLALEQFEKSRQSLLNSLTSLPVCSDTLRVRRQRESLEKQLSQVEEQINIFSRNRVLIRYDD